MSGSLIKVAILDSGFDSTHPDFKGRSIVCRSFLPDPSTQDETGHGTHCLGTACGPLNPSVLPRYGIAYGTSIFVGRVSDADISPAQSRSFHFPIRKAFYKQVGFRMQNLQHPSLHAKKYSEPEDKWQARVNRSWRFYFRIVADSYIITDVIAHPK